MHSKQAAIVLAVTSWWLFAADRAPGLAIELPAEGRPANFSDAVGTFRIRTAVDRAELGPGQSFVLTLTVEAAGRVVSPPIKPQLSTRPGFNGRFVVEDLPDGVQPPTGPWAFRYRLKPLTAGRVEVPAVRFDYFTPGVVPPERGYRTTYAPAIALRVLPRPSRGEPDMDASGKLTSVDMLSPETNLEIVLQRAVPGRMRAMLVISWLFGVPAVVLAWGFTWRAVARRCRSREAAEALRALRQLPAQGANAEEPAQILIRYLRRRFRCPVAEPTPDDVVKSIQEAGAPEEAGKAAADFIATYDAWRFALRAPACQWRAYASQIIESLEGRG